MLGSIGIPEIVVILLISLTWVIPIAAAVWVVVTLHRIRMTQEAMRVAIEQLLQRR